MSGRAIQFSADKSSVLSKSIKRKKFRPLAK